MDKIKKLPELLAPGGSPAALSAAIDAGADAVYFGGKLFNARMNAKNFDDTAMRNAIDRCHQNGVRAYITLNTQIYDKELEAALKYAAFLYESGADALIIADLGLASLIKKYIPDLELHASTQASGHSTDGAKAFAALGFSRMVCAREASIKDIAGLVNSSPIETELFVHGAMCVCHSGQCLMSSIIGGRSGNRGECAQPCRMKYNGSYPLSLKDMALGSHVKELIDIGVHSFKIEGRMKSPDYVYAVTNLYRRLIDEERNADAKELAKLADVFSRSGFSDAYYTGKISKSMLGIRSEQDKESTRNVEIKRVKCKRTLKPIEKEIKSFALPKSDFFKLSRKVSERNTVSARFENPSQIPQNSDFSEVYLPLDVYITAGKEAKKANGIILPPVIFDSEREAVLKKIKTAKSFGAIHALITNISQFALLKDSKQEFILHIDFRLNTYNCQDFNVFEKLCSPMTLADVIVSCELSSAQMRDLPIKKSVVVYGRQALMLLEKPVEAVNLKDRANAVFPIIRENGRDVLYNSAVTYMADKTELLDSCGLFNRHFIFTTESREQCAEIISAYRYKTSSKNKFIRRIK